MGRFFFLAAEVFDVDACAGLLPALVLLAVVPVIEFFAVDFCGEALAGATCAGAEFA